MLHEFLDSNRDELIERCRAKVAKRLAPRPTHSELEHGIPLFLGQLIDTLRNEQLPEGWDDPKVSSIRGQTGKSLRREIGRSAAKHGHELLQHGFTVNQVVHDYGDLCQAITELAVERKAPVAPEEFKTLNLCLDQAIADAVTEFGWQHDRLVSQESDRAMSEQLGYLAHELRNLLNTAILSFAAIKQGNVSVHGATSAVLDRSHDGLRNLVNRALVDVRLAAGPPSHLDRIAVDTFIADVQVAAALEAKAIGCEFTVFAVEPALAIHVDRQLLNSAVSNVLQNAFKFSRAHGHVTLKAYGAGDRVLIEVEDQCGGLPEGKAETMFTPFVQNHADKSGLGLGLSITRRAVEASGGKIRVRDLPGSGCVFTIDLQRADDRRADPAGVAVANLSAGRQEGG